MLLTPILEILMAILIASLTFARFGSPKSQLFYEDDAFNMLFLFRSSFVFALIILKMLVAWICFCPNKVLSSMYNYD